jgi:hypothetical protein
MAKSIGSVFYLESIKTIKKIDWAYEGIIMALQRKKEDEKRWNTKAKRTYS